MVSTGQRFTLVQFPRIGHHATMASPLTTSGRVCSVCGGHLSANGTCPGCLLRDGLYDPGAGSESKLSSGVFGDFEISRREDGSLWELGRGAMGVTYRAVDNVLKRTVALKVIEIRPGADGARAIRERFLREARVAGGLRHPNVAEVFHFEALPEVDRCYYAMELVVGETLESRVRRDGPLETTVALDVAVQVTRALVAAALQGLIHRDLKPANIMVSAKDCPLQVKVIDFGLAKAVAKEGVEMESTHGGFVGTPTFASPEQFRGVRADARSDIYSLGVTLWYALTGEVPYVGRSIEEIRRSHELSELPVRQLIDRKVPGVMVTLLRRVLAPDPIARPQSAKDLLAELESCRAKIASVPGRRRKRRAGAAVMLTAAVLAVVVAWQYSATEHRARPVLAPEASIAILPFESRSKNAEDAILAADIQNDVQTSLAKRSGLRVINATSTSGFQKPNRPGIRQIGQELGVANVLDGTVSREGDRLVVSLQLIDTRTTEQIWANRYNSQIVDSSGLPAQIASHVAAALAGALSPEEVAFAGRVPTLNAEAYEEYLRGIAQEARESNWNHNQDEILRAYGSAVRLDPSFSMAWARLSKAHSMYYWFHFDHTDGRVAQAKNALEIAERLQPGQGETHLARGYFHFWCERNYEAAIQDFSEARKRLPNSADALRALGYVVRRQGRWNESAMHLEQAAQLDPLNPVGLQQWGNTMEQLQRFPEERTIINRIIAIEPKVPRWIIWKARTYQFEGDLESAARLLESISSQIADSDLVHYARSVWFYQRNYQKVIESCLGGRPKDIADWDCDDILIELAQAQQWAGDEQSARTSFLKVRDCLENGVSADPEDFNEMARLGVVCAGLGDRSAAVRAGERAVATTQGDAMDGPRMEVNLAQIYAQLGDAEMAVRHLPRLLQTTASEINLSMLKLDPIWDPIRGDPRFQRLLANTLPDDAARMSQIEPANAR